MQRWERHEALPVHRKLHGALGSVFAFEHELDAGHRAVMIDPKVGFASTLLHGSGVSASPSSTTTYSPRGATCSVCVTASASVPRCA